MPTDPLVSSAFPFPAPTASNVDVLIVAGEHSGDEHAARMVSAALKRNPTLKVAALGGANLKSTGAELICDMMPYAIVGIFEVLKHYSELKKLRDEIVKWILKYRPSAVCFVDYPGLNLRLAKKLAEHGVTTKSGGDIRLLYYISPQVWAWKAKRRFEMAGLIDTLGVIFPFEVETFEDTELETTFVGHPFLAENYQLPTTYDADGDVLLLPGSRSGAIGRIAPVMFQAFGELLSDQNDARAKCMYASDTLKELLESILSQFGDLKERIELVPNSTVVKASSVLTSSGTMSLNCALSGIPGAVVYRVHPLTYLFGKMVLKIPYIGIANILLHQAFYPEFIQRAAKARVLSDELLDCLNNRSRIEQTGELSRKLRTILDKPASGGAGAWLDKNVSRERS